MAEILSGAPVAAAIMEACAARVHALAQKGVTPTLAIVRPLDRDGDAAYEQGLVKRAKSAGVAVQQYHPRDDAVQETLLALLQKLNTDAKVHGVLVLRPLPKQFCDAAICAAIDPRKDVDGCTPASLSAVFSGTDGGFAPCTAEACIKMLEYYRIPCAGKSAVVIGRSLVVGRPAAMLLLQRDATVTICHTKTPDLAQTARNADILIAAAGKMGLVDRAFLREGQTVLDVGIHFDAEGNMRGDVVSADAKAVSGAFTPVPGGVGSVTSALLIAHTIEAACRQTEENDGRA